MDDNEKNKLSYDELKTASAQTLLQLSLTELDRLIEQAVVVGREAHAIKTWVMMVKAEKIMLEGNDDDRREGE